MGYMEVTEILLPGVGMRYEFTTAAGQKVGVIIHRDGMTEIIGFRGDDPDAAKLLLELTGSEADIVSEILGGLRFSRSLADLTREIPGLHTEPIRIPAVSSFAGKTLGETHCRTITGASVVAVVRGEDVISSPGPDQILLAGDTIIVIGTRTGIHQVMELVRDSGA